MLRYALFFLGLTVFGQIAHAQSTCTGSGRFVDTMFSCVQVQKDIQYGTGIFDWSWGNLFCLNLNAPPYQTELPLRLDWYEPCGDTLAIRPLVIAIHGGAWAQGDKNDLAALCTDLAKRGYVVASINYRLSLPSNLLCWDLDVDSVRMMRAVFRAIQDAKASVRYFRANADTYRIDTCNIFTLGVSAGAFTALGVAYLNQESERMGACGLQTQYDAWFGNWICPDMGSIEGKGGNPGFSSSVRAVVNLSGGLFDLNWIDDPSDPPLLTFHGTADDVVPYGYGCVVQNAINLNIFHKCIHESSANVLQDFAESRGVDAQLITFPGGGHGYTAAEIATIQQEIPPFLCARMKGTVATYAPAETVRSVFPNPVLDDLQIVGFQAGDLAQLFDLQGRMVLSGNTAVVDCRGLRAGMYVWRVGNWSGKVVKY